MSRAFTVSEIQAHARYEVMKTRTASRVNVIRSDSMNPPKTIWLFLLAVTVSLAGSGRLLSAQQTTDQNASAPSDNAPADNTKVNRQDQNPAEPTADQQKNNRSDREITKQIRRAIVNDKSLSTYAHNVKIITQDGQVTLKGPVRSDEEKQAIEAKATAVVGENKVTSELAVKPRS
jgi:hyperosmotically inducible periplasmic protein